MYEIKRSSRLSQATAHLVTSLANAFTAHIISGRVTLAKNRAFNTILAAHEDNCPTDSKSSSLSAWSSMHGVGTFFFQRGRIDIGQFTILFDALLSMARHVILIRLYFAWGYPWLHRLVR